MHVNAMVKDEQISDGKCVKFDFMVLDTPLTTSIQRNSGWSAVYIVVENPGYTTAIKQVGVTFPCRIPVKLTCELKLGIYRFDMIMIHTENSLFSTPPTLSLTPPHIDTVRGEKCVALSICYLHSTLTLVYSVSPVC